MTRYYLYDSVTDTYADFAKPKSAYKRPVGRPRIVKETALATVSNDPRPRRMKLVHQIPEEINNPVLNVSGREMRGLKEQVTRSSSRPKLDPKELFGRLRKEPKASPKLLTGSADKAVNKGVSKVIKSKPAIALASVGALALGGVGVSKLSKLIKNKTKKGKTKDNSNNQVTK